MPFSEIVMTNIIFCGVGGQGVLLAGKILMEVAKNAGYDIKESEIHGMAQRGGSVDCHVRYGKKVYSPLIAKGTADFIVSFELLESMRKLDYLKEGGKLIVNREQIDPAPVTIGAMQYPDNLEGWIKSNIANSLVVDTASALKVAGSRKVLNVVMLGALSSFLEFSDSEWAVAIESLVKENYRELNRKAFDLGKSLVG